MLELQEREIASYGIKKEFSDIVNFIKQLQIDKSMELSDPKQKVTILNLQQAIDLIGLQRKVTDITVDAQIKFSTDLAAGGGPSHINVQNHRQERAEKETMNTLTE